MKINMLRKLSAYTLVLGFLLSSILPIIAASGTASAATLASVSDRAASWSLMRLVVENVCPLQKNISVNDAVSGNLTTSVNNVSVGYQTAGNADQMSCKDALKKGLGYWDPANDTGAFLVKIGYTLQGDKYVQGSGYSTDAFVNALPASLFSGSRTAATNDILYQIFYTNFISGCQAQFKELYASASPNDQKSVDTNDNWYRIFQVSTAGNVEDAIYTAALGKGQIINVGYGIGTNNPGRADCYEISQKLQNKALATAYAPLVKTDASAQNTSAGSTTTGGSTSGSGSNSCYSGIPIFGWILCPFLDIADGAYGWAKSVIQGLLRVDPAVTTDSNLQQSWSIMRNISSAAIVLVALTMIAGQIFNFEFMSAYTVKKVLPRLVIAAILIQLSWFLFTTMIIIVNAIGDGLYSLLTAPFTKGGGGDIIDITGLFNNNAPIATAITSGAIFAGAVTATVVGGALIFSGGALLTVVLAAIGVIISILITIFTLVVRKTLIIVLLALAPLALVAWILPNTKRFWDMWWKLFSRLLLMYPLIMLLFAAGTIAANILAPRVASTDGPTSALNFIIVIVAYFAPLFLIPSTFKFAGGMFTNIVGGLDKLGSRARNSGYFGMRDQAKANRQAVKDYRRNKGYEDIAHGATGYRGLRARYRTGTIGGPGFGDARQAYEKRDTLALQKGEHAIEEEAIAELSRAGYNSLGYSAKQNLLKESSTKPMGAEIKFTGADGQEKIIINSDAVQRQLLNNAAATGNIAALRDARAATTPEGNPGVSAANWENIVAGKNFGAVNSLAPDLVMPPDKAFNDVKADSMVTWKDSTMQAAIDHLTTQRNEAVASGDAAKIASADAASRRFGQALSQIASDPKLSSRMSNETLSKVGSSPSFKTLLAGAGVDPVTITTINKIQTDGTIKP